jgi:carboxypeptidase Taq
MALEESQSLLLEMVVVRSRAFVQYLQPLLEKHFGVSGPEWQPENLYQHLTRVRRSLIRAESDELTYPAHIMLRYDLEKRLLSGDLRVTELPEAWNAGIETRLGLRPQSDVAGCLQDVHWAVGSFGYFPSYAVGALIAAQLWEQIRIDRESVDVEIARGEFGGLFDWLRDNVHGYGAKVTVQELVKLATGKPLSAAPALRYLEGKYLEPRATARSASPAVSTASPA